MATLHCGYCGATLRNCPPEAAGRAYCSESHARKHLGEKRRS